MKKKNEDLRIIKTKNSLCKALSALLNEKDITEISIADICAAADVNRSTFYKHFESKPDFVSFYISSLMGKIASIFRSDVFASNSSDFHIETAIWELQRYEGVLEHLIMGKDPTLSTGTVYSNMVDYFLESFTDIPFAFPGENPDVVMWSQFYAGGILMVILSWLNSKEIDNQTKSQMMSQFLSDLLSNIRCALATQKNISTTRKESDKLNG